MKRTKKRPHKSINIESWIEDQISNIPQTLPGGKIYLKQILDNNPEIADELHRINAKSILVLVGGLLTIPRFAPNTVRLEALSHFAFYLCRGKKIANNKSLDKLLNDLLFVTKLADLEDPVEDLFILNVISPIGNHRIFRGVWETPDYWLQKTIQVLFNLPRSKNIHDVQRGVISILQISDLIAEGLKLHRYSEADGYPKGNISIPKNYELGKLKNSIFFSFIELEKLEITKKDLLPFLSDLSEPKEIENEAIGNSSLERKPLLLTDEGIYVILPTAISVAVRRYVLEYINENDLIDTFIKLLRDVERRDCFFHSISKLSGEDITEKLSIDDSTVEKICDDVVVQFDSDKYAHLILLYEDTNNLLSGDFTNFSSGSNEDLSALKNYLEKTADYLSNVNGQESSGLTIIIGGGLGGVVAAPTISVSQSWHLVLIPLSDWMLWQWHSSASFLFLWKLKQHIALLKRNKISIINYNGDINLLAYWIENNFELAPSEMPFNEGGVLYIATDFILGMRNQLRKKLDIHAGYYIRDDVWIPIQRILTDPYFSDDVKTPMFVNVDALSSGILIGCIETNIGCWWITAKNGSDKAQQNFIYLIWKCLLSWVVKLAYLLEETVEAKSNYIFNIEIELSGFGSKGIGDISDIKKPEEPKIVLNPGKIFRLCIPRGFLHYLYRSTNIGERLLIKSIVTSVAKNVEGFALSEQKIADLINKVVSNDDARFIHLFYAKRAKEYLAGIPLPEPRLVKGEDVVQSRYKMLSAVKGNKIGVKYQEKAKSRKYLNNCVDILWKNISDMLSKFDVKDCCKKLFENLDSLIRDEDRWKITANALSAVHTDRGVVIDAAATRHFDRNAAALTTRVAIEMAICTCKPESDRKFSNSDFDYLIANIYTLIKLAYLSDAIQYDVVKPGIEILPNGDLNIDDQFVNEIVIPYGMGHFEKTFTNFAENYSSYLSADKNGNQDNIDVMLPSGFRKGFKAEYNIKIHQFIEIIVLLENRAAEKNEIVVSMNKDVIKKYLIKNEILPDLIESFLSHFSLPVRENWDEYDNKYFNQTDWYPWRFRRKLSLMSNPLIEVPLKGGKEYMYSAAMIYKTGTNIIDGMSKGHYPSEYFESQEMKSWVGKANDMLGHDFEITVEQWFHNRGFKTRINLPMTELGADEKYGDIDVFAWNQNNKVVWLIECKRLILAKTIGEICEQMEKFRGESHDLLQKHINRINWIRRNTNKLKGVTNQNHRKGSIKNLIVTNTIVPMMYKSNLNIEPEKFVQFSKLQDVVK